MPVYEVVVVRKPTKTELDKGVGTQILVANRMITAPSPFVAVLGVGAECGDKLAESHNDQLEVLVRPFVGTT